MTDPRSFSRASGKAPETSRPQAESTTALLNPPLEADTQPTHGPVQIWMHRISVFLFVLVSAVAGVLLIILPWTP